MLPLSLKKSRDFEGKKQHCVAGEQNIYSKQPKWDTIQQMQMKKAVLQKRNIIQKNAIIMLSLGFLYLNFADVYHSGYSAWVEKCIQCFAIVFQGSASKNYARKTLHMIAYLKKM